jgi:RNA recognition motif-containing protein
MSVSSSADFENLEEDIRLSGKKAIYVANIPLEVSQENIVSLFSQFGPLLSTQVFPFVLFSLFIPLYAFYIQRSLEWFGDGISPVSIS